jgi:sulfur carrier protein ThiS adenylyltransferase
MNIFEQGLLKFLKPQELSMIQSKRVGIGGAGGLGSNCAMILVRSGFKHLEIIDQDLIDASNINRQQYYTAEIGSPKVEVLKKRLLDINPDAAIVIHQTKWHEGNAENFFKGFDYIVEAFDVSDWKYRFVQYYAPRFEVIVSGVGMAGLSEKKPMTVKKMGNVYICGDRITDSALGHPPMAPRVTQCAAMMAEIILDLTLGVLPLQTPHLPSDKKHL